MCISFQPVTIPFPVATTKNCDSAPSRHTSSGTCSDTVANLNTAHAIETEEEVDEGASTRPKVTCPDAVITFDTLHAYFDIHSCVQSKEAVIIEHSATVSDEATSFIV